MWKACAKCGYWIFDKLQKLKYFEKSYWSFKHQMRNANCEVTFCENDLYVKIG